MYANINGEQSTVLHQRPYIPHFHVHADTLGEVFIICDSAAGFVPQGNNCRVFQSFLDTRPPDLLIMTMGNICFLHTPEIHLFL